MWTASVWLLWAYLGNIFDTVHKTEGLVVRGWRRYLYDRDQKEEAKTVEGTQWWKSVLAALCITGAAICATLALNR